MPALGFGILWLLIDELRKLYIRTFPRSIAAKIACVTVRVNSQICHGVSQYDQCSTNNACGCLHRIDATDNIGICGFLRMTCSQFIPCESSNSTCYEPDHICIYHPRCRSHPICYPLSMTDKEICPPKTTLPYIPPNSNWTQDGISVAGGNGIGRKLNQLSNPFGFYMDDTQTLYIADLWNHRIVEWKTNATSGQVIAGGNGEGNSTNHNNRRVLRWSLQGGTSGQTIIENITCWGLTMDNEGFLYVPASEGHEVRRWRVGETNGIVVAGGNGRGDRLDQLNSPAFAFVDQHHSVFVADKNNHRVMKWMKGMSEGIIVAGGQGEGDALTQLDYPEGVIVDQLGTVYVADCNNHRIMRWKKGDTQGSIVVGGNGHGNQTNQLYYPTSLSFDQQGNLYVVDDWNQRVQKFLIEESSRN
ncbi:unnamed protein product [Adineta steineri]|uniref:Uncharacterized protein n=1 Tax=Adineta steineri TaxID=433720 RepID=A0A819UT78_9BILA|nr:unnamed protein product [Adineta steineri]